MTPVLKASHRGKIAVKLKFSEIEIELILDKSTMGF